ncbi:putative DNA-binding domain-containing protein [Conchiformibius steedae DSM 2580]|uniref:DNA-binding domain-containing protein n=1 Tax=Conchiformibius steedae DSM 2580 TaxID=1121352 RepID=A0AAE9KYZ2_9NEIS|nr:putative DNA-binding domain-containing protein [Conchiformibius steedae]QMT33568.1 putative DNA-binding domain-containing protein [Conchiformibius steedae]URD68227.1 putative DNA-binding domain-containing protein [Conchiformibius steedae DSM 2580]
MSEAKISSAEFQAMLANYVRDPSQPAPPGMPAERLAVYNRLVRNNIKNFLDLCFSDSQHFADAALWERLQNRFLAEAKPESPFFNDIPAQFLAYAQSKNGADKLPDNVLAMMDFETALLHAETALLPESDGSWQDDTLLRFSPAARLTHYPCDFVSSGLERLDEGETAVLTWRNPHNEVYYRKLENTDLFLLEHFSSQDDSLNSLAAALYELTGNSAEAWLRDAVGAWIKAGVLLPVAD